MKDKNTRYLAEQFTFPFLKPLSAGDKVVVYPKDHDDFKKFVGEVITVMTSDDGETSVVVEDPETGGGPDIEWNVQTVLPEQCSLI